MIAGQDQDQVGSTLFDEAEVLLNGIGSSLKPIRVIAGFVGSKNLDAAGEVTVQIPGRARADVLDQRLRPILRQHH